MKCPTCNSDLSNAEFDRLQTKASRRAIVAALLTAVVAVPLVFITAMVVMPTGFYWLSGRLKPVERTVSVSPDGRHRVTVTTRIHVPVNEVLDPSILVEALMLDVSTGEPVDGFQFFLWEGSDFGKPTVDWTGDGVATVADMDALHHLSGKLDAKRWTSDTGGRQ